MAKKRVVKKQRILNKKTEILISVIIILIIAIILTNLNFITGKIIYKDKPMEEGIYQEQKIKEPTTQIIVSPNPVKRGEYMTITLKAGKTGTDELVEIRKVGGERVVESLNMNCNGPTCFDETIMKVYKSSTGWEPGDYMVVAKDYASSEGTEVKVIFQVIG